MNSMTESTFSLMLSYIFVCNVHHLYVTANSDCGILQQPDNGYVNISKKSVNGRTIDVASYHCNDNSSLQGNRELICHQNNSWSGKPPSCSLTVSEVNSTLDSILPLITRNLTTSGLNDLNSSANSTVTSNKSTFKIECSKPTLILNASYKLYGSSLLIKCEEGYHPVGNIQLECLKNGSWSGDLPHCVASESSTPSSGDNGTESNSTLIAPVVTVQNLSQTTNSSYHTILSTTSPMKIHHLLWKKKLFLHTKNWSGSYNFRREKQHFDFIITNVKMDDNSEVSALFNTKDTNIELSGNIKDNGTKIVFKIVKLHKASVIFHHDRHWFMEGKLFHRNGELHCEGKIRFNTSDFNSFTMKPYKDVKTMLEKSNNKNKRASHPMKLVLGVVIPMLFLVVALLTGVMIFKRRGVIKYGGGSTLTSFENPVYEYEKSLR